MASGFERTTALNTLATALLNVVAIERAKQTQGQYRLLELLYKLNSMPSFTCKAASPGSLFEAEHKHAGRAATCRKCSTEPAVV